MGGMAQNAQHQPLRIIDMKKPVGIVNPVAKALLQQRKSPQVVPPKKGNKRKLSKKEKQNALRNEKLY